MEKSSFSLGMARVPKRRVELTEYPDIPEELMPGLDLFAAAWIQKWAKAGGSVYIEGDGRAMLGLKLPFFRCARG